MRAYAVVFPKDDQNIIRYAMTQKDAKGTRRELMESENLKLAQISIEQVEIPSKKEDFFKWIHEGKKIVQLSGE